MEKTKKAIIVFGVFLSVAQIIILWLGIFLFWKILIKGPFNDSVPHEQIFSYVNANYRQLEDVLYNEILEYSGADKEDFIKQLLGKKTIVKSVEIVNEDIVDFYCGGSGLSTGATYTGFYYSKNNTPYCMGFEGALTEIDKGVYEWQNKDGSHRVHTEKIRDYWYYYSYDYY